VTNPAPDSGSSRVLLVDDDPALLRMLALIFRTEGFDVLTARNGVEALDVIVAQPVDAIVLDLQMPVMDGREFYREVRTRGLEIPVVILSAYGAEEARRELGAPAAVTKPFDTDLLVNEVRRLLESKRDTPPPDASM
jgi:DNA-binding response OmpR family regulator